MRVLDLLRGLLGLVHVLALCTGGNALFYRAAVVQYTPLGSAHEAAARNLALDLAMYDRYAAAAAEHRVDIIVFPEIVLYSYPLNSRANATGAREALRAYGERVPATGSVPCDATAPTATPILTAGSCMARTHNVSTVMNMLDLQPCNVTLPANQSVCQDGWLQYNTNAVFDETGRHVATYHKSHVAGTYPFIDQPSKPDRVTWQSSFGPKFGTFICYDLHFADPDDVIVAENVTDFVFPTYWSDGETLTPHMYQAARSRGSNINLLAANGDGWGGGIYARGQPVNVRYVQGGDNASSVMLIADVGTGRDMGAGSKVATVILRPPPPPPADSAYHTPAASPQLLQQRRGRGPQDAPPTRCTPPSCVLFNGSSVGTNASARDGGVGCSVGAWELDDASVEYALVATSLLERPAQCPGSWEEIHSANFEGCSPDVYLSGLCLVLPCPGGMCSTPHAYGPPPQPARLARLARFTRLSLELRVHSEAGSAPLDIAHFFPFAATGASQVVPRGELEFTLHDERRGVGRIELNTDAAHPSSMTRHGLFGAALEGVRRAVHHAPAVPRHRDDKAMR